MTKESKESFQGGYYHIYNRGNRKQDIFIDKKDYIFYLERLRKYKEKNKIALICYCLMPNHIHLLVRQDSATPIHKFISPLHTSYSMVFNKRHDRVGHLFQGRFRQKHISNDEYLLQLSSYIHLNPSISKIVEKPEDYQWSSYPDYINLRPGTLCEKDVVLSLLNNSPEEYRRVTQEEIMEKCKMSEFQKALSLKECP